jgi:DNA polymerase-4
VVPSQAPKSIGHEHTFEHDVVDPRYLESMLLDLAESVATRLRRHRMAAGAVQLKLRYEGFETLTRQESLPHQTRDSEPIYTAGIELLRKTLVPGRAVRLVGLTAINLADVQQLTLFDGLEREERLSASIDAVRERFGEKAITRARLLTDRPRRRFDFGERPNKAEPARDADEVDE